MFVFVPTPKQQAKVDAMSDGRLLIACLKAFPSSPFQTWLRSELTKRKQAS